MLQRDVSMKIFIVNEDSTNPSSQSFLKDLGLAIKEQGEKLSGAQKKTGTTALIAIGVLHGEQHSFINDLESFF